MIPIGHSIAICIVFGILAFILGASAGVGIGVRHLDEALLEHKLKCEVQP